MLGKVRVDLNDRERLENLREVMIRFLEDIRRYNQEVAEKARERIERLRKDPIRTPEEQANRRHIFNIIFGIIGFIFSPGEASLDFFKRPKNDPQQEEMYQHICSMRNTLGKISGEAYDVGQEAVSAMDKIIPEIRSNDQALADLFNEICSQYDDETKQSPQPFADALIKLGYVSANITALFRKWFEAGHLEVAYTVTKIACDYHNGKTMTYDNGIAACPNYYNARRTHEIPFDVHLSVLEEVWSKPWEEQRRIMDLRSKWFENSFPLREDKAEKDDSQKEGKRSS